MVAVFLVLSAGSFASDPAVAFSATLYIIMALVFGVLTYKKGIPLTVSTIIMVPIVLGSVFFGSSSQWVQETFKFDAATWTYVLIVYIFAASVLPVWLLLQQ